MTNLPYQSSLRNQGSESLLAELLNGIAEDQPFDAVALISEHSSFKDMPSLQVDLAYEDYWRKVQQGWEIDVDHFVDRFPEIRDRLLHMIDVGNLINQAPSVFLSLMDPDWPVVPSKAGPFEIWKQIGQGTFSRVYFARDLSLGGRPVTLKITRYAVREAEALGRLQHPNIISPLGLYDSLIPGLVVLSMPFCGRATLSELIKFRHQASPLSSKFDYREFLQQANSEFDELTTVETIAPQVPFFQTVAWIGAQIAEGLAYAHARQVCHCDIKPSNILLQQDGLPVLLDFNLSISAQGHSYAGGTLTYMAPEQFHALGTSAVREGAADIFSLGATLIELVQGQPPFGYLHSASFDRNTTSHPLDRNASRFEFDRFTRELLGISFAHLLESCIAIDPIDRPSARELSKHLLQLSRLDKKTISLRSRRLMLRMGVGGLLATTLGVVWAAIPSPSPGDRLVLGVKALLKGDSARTAEQYFTHILAADSSRLDVRKLRVCALVQLQDWSTACGELLEIQNFEKNPEINALLGYVLCRWDRQNELAEHQYSLAHAAGIHRLDVLNNLAVCQIRGNRLEAARITLAQAMHLAPEFPSLLFNNAMLEAKFSRQFQTLPRTSVAEIMLRNEFLSNDSKALLAAAHIYWRASQSNPADQARAFKCLQKAVANGLTRGELVNLPEFPLNQSDPRFLEILRTAPTHHRAHDNKPSVDRLVAPPLQDRQYLAQLGSGNQ